MHESLELLRSFVPTLFNCATRSKHDVESVRNKYRERRRALKASLSTRGEFGAMTCVFDLLWKAAEGDGYALAFLDFIQRVTTEAINCAGQAVRPSVEKLVVTMMTSFGEERSEYKNHLAELAVLARLAKESSFSLVGVERLLPNGRTIDFEVLLKGETNLVEVYNIDFVADKIQSSDDLRSFLENRLVRKLNAKLAGVEKVPGVVSLVPVLWGDVHSLSAYRGALDYIESTRIIASVMMVAQYLDPATGKTIYTLENVKRFLSRVDVHRGGVTRRPGR